MEKEIRIFDTSNGILKITGITFELFDVAAGTLIANDTSRDLNPPNDEWGVKLAFPTSFPGPFQVYTNDPTYKYPGNVIESLEGANTNRIDIDLLALPVHSGGQGPLPDAPTVIDTLNWIRAAPNWTGDDKRATSNLLLNYLKLVTNADGKPEKTEFAKVAQNWQTALTLLGIPFSNLR
jgi:hypothetical protein